MMWLWMFGHDDFDDFFADIPWEDLPAGFGDALRSFLEAVFGLLAQILTLLAQALNEVVAGLTPV